MKRSTVLENANFDFLIKIKFQKSYFIKTCQNMKIVHQEIKIQDYFEKSQSSKHFEIFLSVKKNMIIS